MSIPATESPPDGAEEPAEGHWEIRSKGKLRGCYSTARGAMIAVRDFERAEPGVEFVVIGEAVLP